MILTAAREIVAANGMRGLSTRKAAAAIGYTVGTIYNVFDNLDALIVELNGETLNDLADSLEAVTVTGSVNDDLKSLAATYIDFTNQNSNRWNMLFEHRLPPGQELPAWYFVKVAKLLALVERMIAPLYGKDEAQDCANSARVLWSSMHGICSLATAGKLDIIATDSVATLVDPLIDNFVAGLALNRS